VKEPEDADPVADVLMVAPLLEAGEEVIEALQSVLQGLAHPLDEVLPLDWVDSMLQAEEVARLGTEPSFVRPDGLSPIPRPDLPEEEVGVQTALIVGDAEPEERLQLRLLSDPYPCFPPPDLHHRLVDEDGADALPVDLESVAYRSEALDPLPDGLM
jgi:hypothetical protein